MTGIRFRNPGMRWWRQPKGENRVDEILKKMLEEVDEYYGVKNSDVTPEIKAKAKAVMEAMKKESEERRRLKQEKK